MATVTYKCPNCGGGLVFDPATQKFTCEFCLSSFTQAQLDTFDPASAQDRPDPEAQQTVQQEPGASAASGASATNGPSAAASAQGHGQQGASAASGASAAHGASASASAQGHGQQGTSAAHGTSAAQGSGSSASGPSGKAGSAVLYTCPSCGAQIVTDETTAATFCYYCHNPVVLEGRLAGNYLPDRIIPFQYDKKQATERFLSYVKSKRFVPKAFFNEEQIEKLSGVYYPYWVYDCQVEGAELARGEKIRSWTAGDMHYTETSVYRLEREGTVHVQNITRNALKDSDRRLIDAVRPYKIEAAQPFKMPYLQGFVAQSRDVETSEVAQELQTQAQGLARQAVRSTIAGYTAVQSEQEIYRPVKERWQYLLLPVWVLTYGSLNGKQYYYAMNGQTGEIHGELPVDHGKLAMWSGIFGGILMVLGLLVSYFVI